MGKDTDLLAIKISVMRLRLVSQLERWTACKYEANCVEEEMI